MRFVQCSSVRHTRVVLESSVVYRLLAQIEFSGHGWRTTLLANTARRFIAAFCRWPELVASFVSICHHLRRVALPSSFNSWSLILPCTAVLARINHCISLYLNVSHFISLCHTVSHCVTVYLTVSHVLHLPCSNALIERRRFQKPTFMSSFFLFVSPLNPRTKNLWYTRLSHHWL